MGSMIAYFNIFGTIMSSLYQSTFENNNHSYLNSKNFYVLVLALSLLPFIFKREVKELKIISVMLFYSLFSFVIVLVINYLLKGSADNPDENHNIYYKLKFDRGTVTSISIFLWAYSFQLILFPTYRSMKTKNTKNGMDSVKMNLFFLQLVIIPVAFASIYLYGSNIKTDILQNFGIVKTTWETYLLRIFFIIVVVCHIPFIFFVGKECFLTIVDEILRKSISKSLNQSVLLRSFENS